LKIAVCVKHAVDESELKVDSFGQPQLAGAVAKISTFDKNAVEEALRLKSAIGGEVTAITVGPADARKTLKEALAMGADKGVHIVTELGMLNPGRTAELIAGAFEKSGPFDIIIFSEGSSDTYTGLVPPMVAERLGLPFVGYVKKLEVSGESVKAERSLEESLETVESPLPTAISVVSEVNEPRYPTLIQIMQASKKPVAELKAEELLQGKSSAAPTIISLLAQQTTRKHVMIEGTPDEAAVKLIQALNKEGVL
jgi:electron transfer flavoprotein beta subunit